MSTPRPTTAARRPLLPMIAPAVLALAVFSAPTAHADEATINGVVTEGDAPVADVTVSAYRLDDSAGGYVFEQQTESSDDGAWTLEFLPDGDYTLFYDTDNSSAKYALGETLDGSPELDGDEPAFRVAGGSASSDEFANKELSVLGGSVTLEVTRDGQTLTDLDDAKGVVRGIDETGAATSSQEFWAGESGSVEIRRVAPGAYVPWISAGGNSMAPVAADAIVTPGVDIDFGKLEIPAAATGEITADGAPAVEGSATVGETLTLTQPGLTPAAELVSHRWSLGLNTELAAEGPFTVPASAEGQTIRGWVFAHAAGYAPYIGSAESPTVGQPGTPGPTPTDGSTASPSPTDGAGTTATPAPGDGSGSTPGGDQDGEANSGGDGLASTGGQPALILLIVALLGSGVVVLILRRRAAARAEQE